MDLEVGKRQRKCTTNCGTRPEEKEKGTLSMKDEFVKLDRSRSERGPPGSV